MNPTTLSLHESPKPLEPLVLKSTSTSGSPLKPLSALKPVDVTPEWKSTHDQTMLQNIERLEIAKAVSQGDTKGKNQRYVVNVYHGRQVETTKSKPCVLVGSCSKDLEPRQPDMQVVHSVGQFCSLRNSVHVCVQTRHHGSRCAFCEQLASFVKYGSGRALPFASMAYTPAMDASALLSAFMNHVLQESQLALQSPQGNGCRGQLQLPRVLHAFIYRTPQP